MARVGQIAYFFKEKMKTETFTFAELTYQVLDDCICFMRTHDFQNKQTAQIRKPKKQIYLKKFNDLFQSSAKFAKRKGYTQTLAPEYEQFQNDSDETEYLSWEQLKKLTEYDFSESPMYDAVRDVFVFMSYTGFLWGDLLVFNENPKKYIETAQNGKMWLTKPRNKTTENQVMPFFAQTKAILEKYEYVLPLGVEQTHNTEIKVIIKFLGISMRITNRCGRKTAGMVKANRI